MEEHFRVLKPYLRGAPLILLSMVLAVLVARKYLGYVTPMYESSVKLKLADVNEGVPSSNLFKDLDVFASPHKIAGEIELIRSTSMISKVLDSLDFDVEIYRVGNVRKVELYHDSPFRITANLTGKGLNTRYQFRITHDTTLEIRNVDMDWVPCSFDTPVELPGGHVLISLDKEFLSSRTEFSLVDLYEFEILSREKLIEKVSKNLDVVSVEKDVPVLRINFKSPVALKASTFVNAMAKTYISDYIETKFRAAGTTVSFLEERISDIARKLATSELTIQKYRDDRSIINIQQETETDLRKISQLKIQQANLKMNLDAIISLDKYMTSGKDNFLDLAPNFEAFTDLLSTEIIKKIKQLQSDKKDLLLVYTPTDERVKVIDLKMNDLTSYLLESIRNTKNSLQIKYDGLTTDIINAEKVFVGVPGKERMLMILNREFGIYQRSYNFLNEKKIEAEIAQAAKIAFHRVISPAEPSNVPISPNKMIIVIVAAMMGMFGSMVLIFVVHLVKAKVNDTFTIERNSNIPVAFTTPYLEKTGNAEASFLKAAIQLELKGLIQQRTTIAISSSARREGKSFHALNLSEALARQGRKVLLLDIDGQLQEKGTNITTRNINYLSISSVDISTYSKGKMKEYLEGFLNYDILVVNNEPIEKESLGLLIMSIADVNLFLLDSRRTSEKQIAKTSIIQARFGIPGLFFVLNRAGYNPSIIQQSIDTARQALTWIRSKTTRQ
jgi:uncharacterized protein involved in exopolysaccharide biosynthesis